MAGSVIDDAVLIHGTSIKAVLYAIEHGSIPSADMVRNGSTPEYLYFAASRMHFKGHPLFGVLENVPMRELTKTSADYAALRAFWDSVPELLGYMPRRPEYSREDYEIDEMLPEAEQHGIRFLELRRRLMEARERKGVIIYIGSSIFEYPIELDEAPGEERNSVKIHLPDGLPRRHFIGIQPLSDFERKVIKEITAQTR